MENRLTRRRKSVAILAAALLIALAIPPPAHALLGFGDIVFDPTSYATLGEIWSQDITNYAKLIATVQQLEKIYANGEQMYQVEQQMSTRFTQKPNWQTLATGAVANLTRNQYGETVNWAAVMNGNPAQAVTAYGNASLQLNPSVDLSREVLGYSQHLANLASVETIDGTNRACLQAVAQYRANQGSNQTPSSFLNAQSADPGDATNTTIAQLNLLNGAQSQQRMEQVSQGTLQSCLVEEQILANKIQRDNQVAALNTYATIQQKYQSNPMMLTHISLAGGDQ